MDGEAPGPRLVRFGSFEVELRTGEVRRHGIRIRIPEQPFRVLAVLLERPGDLVTRDELKRQLWPSETFVQFDRSLNAAVKKLRRALRDSPRNPHFIETIPKRGYRFIAPVQEVSLVGTAQSTSVAAQSRPGDPLPKKQYAKLFSLATMALIGLGVLALRWTMSGPEQSLLPAQRMLAALPFVRATVSPNGKYLAYTELEDRYIRLRNLEDGSERLLVEDRTAWHLPWSPDSRRLAFSCVRDGIFRLEAVDVESGERRVLREGGSFNESGMPVAWDPDAERVLCSSQSGEWYGFVSLRDSTFTPLKVKSANPDHGGTLSPNGRFFAYSRAGSLGDIELIPARGEAVPIRITSFASNELFPIWSPDGGTVLFVREYGLSLGDRAELWAVDIEPETGQVLGAPFKLAALPGNLYSTPPAVTEAGDVLFGQREAESQVYLLEVDPQTGVARGEPISDFGEGTQVKHWSPDGSNLYYWESSLGRQVSPDFLAFKERDFQTGKDRILQVPKPKLAWSNFSSSRDLNRFVYSTMYEGSESTLYVYDAKSDQYSEIVSLENGARAPRLSHDGNKVAFWTDAGPAKAKLLQVVQLASGELQTLVRHKDVSSNLRWSPDDKDIAFMERDCLKVTPVSGGETVTVTCGPATPAAWRKHDGLSKSAWNGYQDVSWSPDGRMLAWPVTIPAERRMELWIVDRATGNHHVAWVGGNDYSRFPRFPRWSPDGKSIAFTMQTEQPVQVWAMSNLLSAARDSQMTSNTR